MPMDLLQEALFQAIQRGDLARTSALLDQGADVNASCQVELSEPGNLDSASWLRLKMYAVEGITPLMLVSWCGHTALAELLIDRGADINIGGRYAWASTPVMIAAEQEHGELTRLLLDREADINHGWSDEVALRRHVCAGYAELVRALLDRGADVNATNARGQTLLMWTAALSDASYIIFKPRHLTAFRLLLERGADPNAQNKYGLTTLMFAGRFVPVVRLLLEHAADVSLKDHRGRTALKWARIRGRKEAVELLMQAGATG